MRLYTDWYKVTLPLNRLLDYCNINPRVHLHNGMQFVVRIFSDDLNIIAEVVGRDSYGIEDLALRDDALVVDVGANVGVFSAWIKHLHPNAHLVAYEPHPANLLLLQENAPFATIHAEAVVGTEGEVHIEAEGHTSALKLAKVGVAVRAITLEQALAPLLKVDLLKVDIEGSEYDVFMHTPPSAMQKVQQAVVEVHHDDWREWFENYFKTCGFAVHWSEDLLVAKR